MTSENPSPFTSPAVAAREAKDRAGLVGLRDPARRGREATRRAQVGERTAHSGAVVIGRRADQDIREAVAVHVTGRGDLAQLGARLIRFDGPSRGGGKP